MSILESPTELQYLRSAMHGTILAPGDDGWDAARLAYNLTLEQTPALIALPADEIDVVGVVHFARENGYQIAPQRTGHNAEPLGSLDDVILLKTDNMQGVEIYPEQRVARVKAGSKWGDVVPAASELGLAALHGSTPDVSVVGYTLGGGVGWYGRKLGLSANSVVAIELVTADGRLRRVDHEYDPELFWALRGGGGNFGIVTAIEVRLFPLDELYAGVLFFPWERSTEVLQAWREWVEHVPEEMTSVGRILQFPPLEELPPFLRGRNFVVVEGFFMGSEEEGIELMRPLRDLGAEIDTFAMVPPAGISEMHMDPPDPLPYTGGGAHLLRDLPPEAIDALVAVTGPDSGSPLISFELRHTGGALAREEDGHGAIASFPGTFLSFGVAVVFDEATYGAARARLELVDSVLEPYDTGRKYLNFTEHATDPAEFYPAETWERLRAVKAAVDPGRLFRANHSIDPAS